jgi:putative oxidoreductase
MRKQVISEIKIIRSFIQNHRQLLSGFLFVVRVAIGCMFLYSSLPKIRQPYDFLSSVYSYELVGPKLGMFIAMTLPWLEILVGICLIGDIFVGGALLASIVMVAMFTFVLASALYNGLQITCGCFGASSTEIIGYSTLIRSSIILLSGIAAYAGLVILRLSPGSRRKI